LAQKLKISLQQTAPVTDVANAVLELRRSKGMVLDESDSDTKSVGSFFLNPRISVPELPVGAPHWMQSDGKVKVSAAWLIQEAGFSRGFEWKGAAVSTKHTLALCNRNDASSQSIMDLAEKIQTDVYRKFNIKLQLEPQLIN
jgi:UDP-N-acetylmuramate dehydrogenase